MRNKKGKSNIVKYLPVLIILLSITIIVGSTFAYFTDRKDESSNLTFSKVELSSETTVGIDGVLKDVIPGSKLVDGAVAFSKSIDSEAIYVRAKISFSLPAEYANDSDMQQLVKGLRNATDFNINTDRQHDAVWSSKDGNYYYLLNADETSKLMRVDTIDTYTLASEVVVPRDLENLPDNAQYMKSINFHIAFEAIQADNVSDDLETTKATFDTMFPMPGVEKSGIYVSVMNSDLMSVREEIALTSAGKITEPEIEIPTDENGTETKVLEGWYTDAGLTEKFDFNTEVTYSISLYPNLLEVSEGLEYTPIYETATSSVVINNAPDFTENQEGEDQTIIGYSVGDGTCKDSEIVVAKIYKGKPVTEVSASGFYNNKNVNEIVLPDTITKFNNNSFCHCDNLAKVNIPNGVTYIGEYAFSFLQITSIIIPEGVTYIGDRAFESCKLVEKIYYNAISCADFSSFNYVFGGIGASVTDGVQVVIGDKVEKVPAYLFSPTSNINVTSVEFSEGSVCAEIGDYAFAQCDVKEVIIPSNVTKIGVNPFAYNKNLTNVTLEDGITGYVIEGGYLVETESKKIIIGFGENVEISDITTIGECAFSYSLTRTIDISDVVTIEKSAFNNASIQSIELPNTVTSIGQGAFSFATKLTSVTIPSSVTTIGTSAFYGCSALTTLYYNAENLDSVAIENYIFTNIGSNTESGVKVTIGKDVTAIPSYLFTPYYVSSLGYSTNITSVEFEEDSICTSIGSYAFYSSLNLQSVEIPKSVTTIGEYAFYNCISLTTINYNGSATSGSYAFGRYNNSPEGTTTIAVTIGEDVTTICSALFAHARVSSVTFSGDNLVEIGAGAFQNSYLTSIEIPNSVTTIGKDAFYNSSNLKSVIIPNSVTTIGAGAFESCPNIEEIYFNANIISQASNDHILFNAGTGADETILTIGKDVTSIADYQFHSATGVNKVVFEDESKCTSIGSYVFEGCTSLTLIKLPNSLTNVKSYAFYYSITYILCDTSNILNLAKVNGIEDKSFYVKATQGYDDITFTAYGTNFAIGTDADGRNWVRSGDSEYEYYKQNTAMFLVTYMNVDLSSVYKTVAVKEGLTTTAPTTPTHSDENAQFDGWYTDSEFTNKFDFSSTIKSNLTLYPKYNLGYTLTVMNFGNSDVAYTSIVKVGETVDSVNLATEENGTTTFILDGWYTDSEFTTPFEFGSELTGNTTLYNKGLIVSSGLVYTALYENADDSTEITSYSVAKGTCADTEIVLPNKYLGEPITKIATNGFSGLTALTSIYLPETITSLEANAFQNCSNLELTSLPSGITAIGNSAFYSCSKLALTSLPSGITVIGTSTFSGCTALGLISLPTGITSIGTYAFQNCSSLALTSLPSGITSIGSSVFWGCSNLALTSLPNGVTSIGTYAFYNCTNLALTSLPTGITTISNYAFQNCENIALTSLPSGVTSIGRSVFQNCTKLALTSLPTNVSSIGNNAFQNCENIALTALPSKVKTISDNAFYGCSKLALTSLPSSLQSIGYNAFYECTSLAITSLPSGVTSIGDGAFYGCVLLPNNGYVYYLKIGSTSNYNVVQAVSTTITTVEWPSNVTTISAAFNKCANLVNVIIPSTVTTIGESSFYECTSLESVTIPSNLTSIGDWAFYGCTSLKTITIPEKVTYLGDYSFYNCTSLTEINFNAKTLEDLYSGNGIFYCAGKNAGGITVNIGANVTVVPSYLFRPDSMLSSTNAPNITKVNFATGSVCETIGFYAFANCIGIKSIELPSQIELICYDAFYGCTGLTFVSLPSSVTSIGNETFSGCSSLKYILCATSSVASFASGSGVDDTYIYSLQSSGYSGLTETSVVISDSITIYTATDASGYKWVRTADNKYYKCIVTG